jgi:hypothetical protein
MSKARLQTFLTRLQKELERDSDEYRRATTNRKYTTFTYKSSTIRKVLRVLLDNASNLDGPDSTAQVEAAVKSITPLLRTLTKNLRTKFSALQARNKDNIRYRDIRGGLEVVVFKTKGNRDNFALVQRAYKDELDTFYTGFLEVLQSDIIRPSNTSESGSVNVGTAGQAFNLEHLKGKSNIQDFMNDSIFRALKKVYDDTKVSDELQRELKNLGFENLLKIVKNAENGTVELFLGSQILNALESKKEKALKFKLEKTLKQAIEKLGPEELEGSDSLETGVKKKYTKAIMKPFKKVKGAKVTTEDTKIKEGSPVSLKRKVTATKVVASRSLKKKRVRSSRAGAGSQVSNFKLLGAINANLSKTVQKNMGSPALNYRTGRFAESVRLTDISTTQRGFPSIGYTYQRFPYQTFEVGGAQGTQARDPRKLIDRSIREVAAQLALGRFYTRRQ